MSVKTAIKASVKRQTTLALRESVRRVSFELRLSRLHCRGAKKALQLSKNAPVRLNLGCGPNPKDGWINIDLFHSAADLQLDLREDWPFPENSASYIYSEHVFEHFEFLLEVPHFLREALRVLRPGGVFDVVVPDTEAILKAYGDPAASYWSTSKRWHPAWCHTELDRINYHFRQNGEHKYAWDAESLAWVLKEAGFTSISQRDFDPLLDTEDRRFGSLYMLARKP